MAQGRFEAAAVPARTPLLSTSQTAKPSLAESIFAVIYTNVGSIRLELYPSRAPRIVAHFVALSINDREYIASKTRQQIEDPLYNGTIFHRVVKGLMVSGGEPAVTGRATVDFTVNDEYSPDLTFNRPYLLAMANDGKREDGTGTNRSQFFITLAPAAHLNFRNPIFGEVADDASRRLLDEIAKTPCGPNDRPLVDIAIWQIDIQRVEIST